METWQLFALFALILLSPRLEDDFAESAADVCIIIMLITLTVELIAWVLK